MSSRSRAAGVLVLYALFLFLTNPRVTVFEDEASIVAAARKNVRQTIARFAAGYGEHDHPPLSDILLHLWLRSIPRSMAAVRAPFIVFYCLALWILAETAHLLWNKRSTTVALGIAWPAGYFLGRPAGWYTVAAMELAGLTWFYCRWRETGRKIHLAGLAACALLLVYTNYFGWVFLAALAVDLVVRPAGRRFLRQFLLAMGAVALAFLPLVPVLLSEVQSKLSASRPWHQKLVYGVYMTYSLLASEMVAPWTWPGMIVAACGIGLFWFGWKNAASRRALLLLAGPLLLALALGILGWARMALFFPWFLLFLTSAVGLARTRAAPALAALMFAMGWLGVFTQRYAGAHRYIEPWQPVVSQVAEMSRPGDAILSSHPSFYFYLSYLPGWEAVNGIPPEPLSIAGRILAPVGSWEPAVAGAGHIIYPRSNLMPWDAEEEVKFLDYARKNPRLDREWRFVEDRGVRIKRFFFPDVRQPEWRIELQVWTKR